MNKRVLKLLSSLTLGAMLANIPLGALSYTGLGEITDIKRDTVGDGLTYSEFKSTDENEKPQQAYIFEYSPDGGVLPLVRWGESVYGKDRVGALVSAAQDDGDTVLGAINGDFFSMQTGVPMGVMIDGGRLISTDDSKYALGFKEDGTAIIGKPSVSITVTDISKDNAVFEIGQLNKYPTIWGVYMLTDDFGVSTRSSDKSREIVIQLYGDITVKGIVYGIVVDIIEGGTNAEIPEGCAVISVAEAYAEYSKFDVVSVGDVLQIDTACAEGWNHVTTAIGGGDMILDGGTMPDGIIDEDTEKSSQPRTAVGIKDDGTVVFFAVDGRISASRGMKIAELSTVMAELGCVSALNLDGGGSTTVMVKASDSTECVYINSPADTSYRAVANGLLFVSENPSDGVPAALSVTPNTPYLLSGSTVHFSAQVLDSAYMPTNMVVYGGLLEARFDGEYTEEVGSVFENSFTAGKHPGEYRLKVSTVTSEEPLVGDVSVIVTDTVDSFTVTPDYRQIRPGSYVELNIKAEYRGKEIMCDSGSFTYSLNDTQEIPDSAMYPDAMVVCELGYLDKSGNFQAFADAGEGTVEIGVHYGELSRYVTVDIGDTSEPIADFEADWQLGMFTLTADKGSVRTKRTDNGRKSSSAFEVRYSYTDAKESRVLDIKLADTMPIAEDGEGIKLWISGNISGNPCAVVSDADGNTYKLAYAVSKDYSKQIGWREFTAEIPEELGGHKLWLESLLCIMASGSSTETITIDDAIVYYGTPTLAGLDGHWAAESILALYDMGVIEDSDCETNGKVLTYSPSAELTRGEFAKILIRRQGIDVSEYEKNGIQCEADTPADKLPYIRAAVANGLMSGRGTREDGTVIFDSGATITREEVCKVLGSIITSEDTADMTVFSDSPSISSWAIDGIAKCVGAGVVKGFTDGTIRPQAKISRAEIAAMLMRFE
ncbi:MAG: phosphodiester glycosidase family protein [Clostridia bacterium]|nr:phosphodiester glycosidase family protein [Clostridia bacterium]